MTRFDYLTTYILVSLVVVTSGSSFKPCARRDYGKGSVVCVCNATYCDSAEENQQLASGKIAQFISTKDGKRLSKYTYAFDQKNKTVGPVFTIDRSKSYQSIIGFGGAFTDSTSKNILSLSKGTQDNLLKAYFSPEGNNYNVGRIPIASCDFSSRIYSYDDTPGDFDLKHFALQEEDLKYKIPVIKRAEEFHGASLKLFGSPWGAPGWMKTNGNMSGGGYLKGEPGGQYYKTWANYFVRFLQEYQKQNISLWGLTAENEPLEGQDVHYSFQCLAFTAELQRDFIAMDLGPALEAAKFQNIKLMIMDDQRLSLPAWPKTILQNKTAASKYVAGIAIHWYMDMYIPPIVLDQTHEAVPEYFMFATEACNYKPVLLGSWERLELYTHDIIEDLNHWVTGWTDWNMALDMDGGPTWVGNNLDAAIIVNAEKDEFYKQPTFYAMAHFSKFLHEGSIRISASPSSTTSLQYVAFLRKDGATVFIVSNLGTINESFTIQDPHFGTVSLDAPARSIQTLTWWY